MLRTDIGKIQKIRFGAGGYQDAMIGFSFILGGNSWGVGDFWGDWNMTPSESAKWTEESRNSNLGKNVMRISKILKDAKVETIDELENIPVEVTFDGNTLKSWRVLTEVL